MIRTSFNLDFSASVADKLGRIIWIFWNQTIERFFGFPNIWILVQRRIIGGDRLIISTSFVCPRRYARRPFNGFNDSTRFNGFSSVSIVPLVSLVSKIGRGREIQLRSPKSIRCCRGVWRNFSSFKCLKWGFIWCGIWFCKFHLFSRGQLQSQINMYQILLLMATVTQRYDGGDKDDDDGGRKWTKWQLSEKHEQMTSPPICQCS